MVRDLGFLRGVLDRCEEGVIAFEPVYSEVGQIMDFRVGYLNRAAEGILDRPSGDWLGRTFRGTLPFDQAEDSIEQCVKVWRDHLAVQIERSYDLFGQSYWMRIRLERIEGALVAFFEDITIERQVAGHKESFLKLKDSLVESSETPMWIKSIDGTYTFVNRAFHELLNLKSWEILGRKDSELFSREVASSFLEGDQKALDERRTMRFYQKFPVRGSLKRYITHKYPLFDRDGTPLGIGGYSAEIKLDGRLLATLTTS